MHKISRVYIFGHFRPFSKNCSRKFYCIYWPNYLYPYNWNDKRCTKSRECTYLVAQNLESLHIWSFSTIFDKMFYFNEHQQSLKTWQSLIADSNFKPETISISLLKLSMCQKWPYLLKVAKFANFDNFRKFPSAYHPKTAYLGFFDING